MNRQRILVLAGAFVAAIVVAFLVSHLLGGGTEKAKAVALPPRIAMSDILVASADLSPGTQLSSSDVRWQQWPRASVDPRFITRDANPNVDNVVNGAVVRAPLVAGEPLTTSKIVQHAQSAGLMSALVSPGMRAVSIQVSTETGAGGFILPNDRVDVIASQLLSDTPRRFRTRTLLPDVRVLAVDQTYEGKDQKTVLAKTATLELTPEQSELVIKAQAQGTLSLALRALGDSSTNTSSTNTSSTNTSSTNTSSATNTSSTNTSSAANTGNIAVASHDAPTEADVIRYGVQGPSIMGGRN
jgi:pilus assembly protein CpaB